MKLPQLIYRKIFEFVLFVILEVLAVVLVVKNSTLQSSRVMDGIRSVSSFFWQKSNAIKNYSNLKQINQKIALENKMLLQENQALRDYIIKENSIEKLEELSAIISNNVGESAVAHFDFALAKVVKNTRSSQHNYIIIDKGTKQGMVEDLGVITPMGVVGIIRATGKNFSYVYSFLNTKQSISAKIGNSAVYGSLKWDGKDIKKAHLMEIPLNVEVREGDIVYTSGNSSFFPSDIPIGVVGKYNVSSGTSKDVEVTLFQDFKNLDYVIVVKNKDRAQIDSLSRIVPIENKR